MDDLARQDASKVLPQEFANLVETFEHGEAVLHVQDNHEEADNYYLLTLQKGEVLRQELKRTKERLLEEARQREAEHKARLEEQRLMRVAAEAENRLREQERQRAEEQARIQAKALAQGNLASLPLAYTVRRGETLPQIAARTEIYNDSSLWPIIYRANRDQIRDPKQLWPGQTLKVPRHFSRDEASQARRYSGRK